MENQQSPAELLKKAGSMPSGVTLEDYNPMENIPTVAVGDEFEEGMTITGYFDETQVIASPKFKHSRTKNADGVPTQLRHVLRIGSPTGEKLGIWTTGELKNTFEKLQPGTLISITYKGKGENANGQQQHFFDYKRQSAN